MNNLTLIDRPALIAPNQVKQLQDDCDCACPSTTVLPELSFSRLGEGKVQLASDLQTLPLTDHQCGVWASSTNAPCVVNQSLYAILNSFATPQLISKVTPELWPMVARCTELGLLTLDQVKPSVQKSDVLVAWLHITNSCNLRCKYCYLAKTEEAMTAEVGRAAIDALLRSAELHHYPAIKLKFAGGEPSLNFPLILELQEYAATQAAQRGIRLESVVLSNGVGLTKPQLLQMQASGIELMISLDGMEKEQDAQRTFANGASSFRAVSNTIERAQALGTTPYISATISGQTAAGLADLVGWLLERDLPFSFNFYRESKYSTNYKELELDETKIINGMKAAFRVIEANLPPRSLLGSLIDRSDLSVAHHKTCGVGENYLVIDPQGQIAKCHMEIERPITTIYTADPLAVIRAETSGIQNLLVEEKEDCRACQWKHWCTGGCSWATFRATGRYDTKSPNCQIYKALYPEAIRLEGLRLLRYGLPQIF